MALKNGERVTIMNKKTEEVVEATRKIVGGRLGYVFPVTVNGKTCSTRLLTGKRCNLEQ